MELRPREVGEVPTDLVGSDLLTFRETWAVITQARRAMSPKTLPKGL